MQGSPDEIQRPAQWNAISRSMTAQPPVLSPSSIPTLHSSQCAFTPAPKKKLGVAFKNVTISLLIFFKFRKSKIVYLEIA
jgi:hypothetical protein